MKNSAVEVILSCKDCGKKHSFFLMPANIPDLGWITCDKAKEVGFEFSGKYAYCGLCAKNHKRELEIIKGDFLVVS